MRTFFLAGLLLTGAAGPYDIILVRTDDAPDARGTARLVFATSPFGIAVSENGVAIYDVQVDLTGLPEPKSLGSYAHYVAWAAAPDLSKWYRLGVVSNGRSQVGQVELNKFLFIVTAEADSATAKRTGPTILHGLSPSSWLQSFQSHPMFKGIPPG